MEADLLKKLQETQMLERTAFNKLETAMIDASVPKKMRISATGSNGGGNVSDGMSGRGLSQPREQQ